MTSYSYYRIPWSRYFKYINHSRAAAPSDTEWRCKLLMPDGKPCNKVVKKRERGSHLKADHSEIFESEVVPARKTWIKRIGPEASQTLAATSYGRN